MICPGPQYARPASNRFDYEAAHLRALELFSRDFKKRYPGGEVISELEYMARTTKAPKSPGSIAIAGKKELTRLIQALSVDFRRWVKEGDFRKCDAMGISEDGTYGEILEVTTVSRKSSAARQIRDKLDTLNRTVNMTHNLHTSWVASSWKPSRPGEMFYPLGPGKQSRFICFKPTQREMPAKGVILYEIHDAPQSKRHPVTVPGFERVRKKIHQKIQKKPIVVRQEKQWAEGFLGENPWAKPILCSLYVLAGAGLAIATVAFCFSPVPGDEVLAANAALALFAAAGIR
ncbi:MAG: hypothetical protein AAF206_14010 [Bacteroidota bacterium]